MTKKEINSDSVYINGTEYVPKGKEQNLHPVISTDGLPYVIIRTYSAGVHIGYLKAKESTLAGMEVELVKTRRLYSWAGALTLSDLSAIGTTKPDQCKFTLEIEKINLVAIEIIPVTKTAFDSLTSVKIWKL